MSILRRYVHTDRRFPLQRPQSGDPSTGSKWRWNGDVLVPFNERTIKRATEERTIPVRWTSDLTARGAEMRDWWWIPEDGRSRSSLWRTVRAVKEKPGFYKLPGVLLFNLSNRPNLINLSVFYFKWSFHKFWEGLRRGNREGTGKSNGRLCDERKTGSSERVKEERDFRTEGPRGTGGTPVGDVESRHWRPEWRNWN